MRGRPGARRRNQFRVADDGGEEVVEIVRHAAGEVADRFHLLRLPQLSSLFQRFFGGAALVHFAEEIVALRKEFFHGARHLAELRLIACERSDGPAIAFRQAGHEAAERLAHPA